MKINDHEEYTLYGLPELKDVGIEEDRREKEMEQRAEIHAETAEDAQIVSSMADRISHTPAREVNTRQDEQKDKSGRDKDRVKKVHPKNWTTVLTEAGDMQEKKCKEYLRHRYTGKLYVVTSPRQRLC